MQVPSYRERDNSVHAVRTRLSQRNTAQFTKETPNNYGVSLKDRTNSLV